MGRQERNLLRRVLGIVVVLSAIYGGRGTVSQPPIISPPKFEALLPSIRAVVPSMKPSAPPDHAIMEHKWPRKISPSVETQAPNVPLGAGPAMSPALITSPIIHGKNYGIPVAAPPKEIPSHLSPVNHSHVKGFSPVISPAPHEVKELTHAQPSGSSTVISPAPHEVKPSNVSHSPLASHPHPSGAYPAISPVPHEVKMPSNITHAPLASHPRSLGISPVISPTPHEVKKPSNITHAPLDSHPHLSGSSPAISPVPHEVKKPSNTTHAPLASHPRSSGSSPVISPVPHEVKKPSNMTHAPLASHPHPPAERIIQSPAPATTISTPHSSRKRIENPASAPLPSLPPSYHPGRVISPVPSQPPAEFPKNKQSHHAFPPYIQAPSLSPIQSPSHPTAVSPNNKRRHHTPPPYIQAPSLSSIQAPFPSTDTEVAPAPSPSSTIPSGHINWPIHSPIVSPSGSFSRKPRAPSPQPVWALPPPPPNLNCNSLACSEPLTNPLPGSPCVCVVPIKVGLRLSVALFTFFPLVSELAQEIASGIFMKQSRVRIMGANAASEDPEKTIVLIDLVPLGKFFDKTTPLITYEKFWHKQVLIKASYFGDYDVLYVTYPGLPPSPPALRDINVNEGSYGNHNNSRTIRPLGVDVKKRTENLSGNLIAIVVLSVIALVLSVGAAWLLLLKHRDRNRLPTPTSQSLLPQFAKSSGTVPMIFGSRGPSSASGSFSSNIGTYRGSAKAFSLAEIERATDRLDDSRIIGEGGFGRVYEGTLEDGTRVAVKVLKRDDQQGGREFLAEVEMLSRLHHRNLVKLIGICSEEHIRCLVYELIPNGSVESHLHGVDKEIFPLDWNARMKIALGAARGLAYLHEDSSPRVIHRDFKSSNILLEHDFTPKVSDFGLARAAIDGKEHISTRVMGTFGYVAPEYAMTGHLLVESDVYSYGVVLLELLTGRKPVDMSRPPGQENLVSWAHPLLTNTDGLQSIIDPSLCTTIPFDSVAKVAAIASMCVQPEVAHRPFMGEVVQALKLVCSESDESSTRGGDADVRISTGLGLEEERAVSESDMFSTSARFTRDASGYFRMRSSSGPLRTGRSQKFWQRLGGFSSGCMSEHEVALRLGTDLEP